MISSFKSGLSFGLSSAVITTLGLMVGLYASTNSIKVVLAGIFTIALADALSDALGMHISEESNPESNQKEIWTATFSTFISKFFIALTFAIPFFFLSLTESIYLSLAWGLILLSTLSFVLAKKRNENPLPVILEHLIIAVIVIALTYFIGIKINAFFG
jgi:vacuolar iron transporter family protein